MIVFFFYLLLIESLGSLKCTEFTLGQWRWNLAPGELEPYISVYLLKYFVLEPCLLLICKSCSIVTFFMVNKGPWKGHVLSLPSCSINIYLTYLLLCPQHWHFSFRYRGDNFLYWWYCLNFSDGMSVSLGSISGQDLSDGERCFQIFCWQLV